MLTIKDVTMIRWMVIRAVGFGVTLMVGGALADEAGASDGINLLNNPGFENGTNWIHGWTIENTKNNGTPYFYALNEDGGGHGEATPHRGRRAIEIYSSSRVTRLFQKVTLSAGVYRLSAFAQNQGTAGQQLRFSLEDFEHSVPVVAMDYRHYYADFDVPTNGTYEVAFVSFPGGMALDDLSLLRKTDASAEASPHLFFDLCPSSRQRSQGFQPYGVGQRQWVDFTISCIDAQRLHAPRMRIYCPETVKLWGFNEEVLERWALSLKTPTAVEVDSVIRDGVAYNRHTLFLPRFVNGPTTPMDFGGFWVEVPSGGSAKLLIEFEDQGERLPLQEITLVPVPTPERQLTPRRILTVAYHVQNWKQDLNSRLEALPRQFAMMGLNVWSDYGLQSLKSQSAELTTAEQVQAKAFRDGFVTTFWPNTANMLETDGGAGYSDLSDKSPEKDMYRVKADGKVDAPRRFYSLRYIAQGGKAWLDSVLAAYQYTLRRPRDLKLPYANDGFITDGLEDLKISYDATTLDAFAQTQHLDRKDVTSANLNGKLKPQWLAYNMGLYVRIARNWADAMRAVDPKAKTINTLGSFGPNGSDSLGLNEQMDWAKGFDYTMPQWYAMRNYSDVYHQEIVRGVAAKVYGKANGYADVIPLLNVSMGVGLQDPIDLRFKMFDLLSTDPAVKGIGYYIATHAFSDGQFMAGLSRNHTLLADVEDYFADGVKMDAAATFVPNITNGTVRALDADGQTAMMPRVVKTTVRVHRLDREGRLALLTVISHSNQGTPGEEGQLKIDLPLLTQSDRGLWVLYDHLNRTVQPLPAEFVVDTRATGGIALLEIFTRDWATAHGCSEEQP